MLDGGDDEPLYPLSTIDNQMYERMSDIVVLSLNLFIRVSPFFSPYNIPSPSYL